MVFMVLDEGWGQAAVQQFQTQGLSPHFHLLDTKNLQSICARRPAQGVQGPHMLVNNEGIIFKGIIFEGKNFGALRAGDLP